MNDTLQIENTLIAALGGTEQNNAMQAQFERHRLYNAANLPELRPYQADLVARSLSALGQHRSVCMQAPTGAGKSVMFSAIAHGWPGKLYLLTHRHELERQTAGHMQKAGRHDVTIMSPIRYWNRVQKGELTPEWGDLLIVDECHHAAAMTWERAITQFPGRVLGATATPWRLSKREGLDHIFDHLECSAPMSELLDVGALAHAHVKLPHEDDRVKGTGNNGGDYSELATWNANGQRIMVEKAIDWLDLHNPGRALVYACGHEHGEALLAYLGDRRRPALLTSKTDTKERRQIERNFQDGTLDTLINISILTEGVDVPETDCVVLTRPTKSLALYLQMVGRALRPKDKPALILDCCGMSLEHGLPEEDRTWMLKPRGEPKPGKQWPMPVCAECGTCNSPMQKYCIGCGVQRWHTCDRCSKPIFHEDGPDTECERCNPLNDELMKLYHDDYGHPIWCAERDRPILGYTKISRGLYAGLFGAIWRYNVAHAPILEAGTVITMKSKT